MHSSAAVPVRFVLNLEVAAMSNVTLHDNLIRDALQEALEKIKAGIDLGKAERVLQERLGMGAIEGIDLQELQAVVHEGKLAFRCRMTVRRGIVMILDHCGNCTVAFPEKEGPHPMPGQGAPESKKPFILIADDDKSCLEVIVRMVKSLGYDAFGVENGLEAIEVYHSMKHKIDLVVLDMIMPFSGEKTYTSLRKINSDARILLMSGYTEDHKIRALLGQKYSWFITKPFNLDSFKRKLADIFVERPP
jgi:CheY-like chemotaxis protein